MERNKRAFIQKYGEKEYQKYLERNNEACRKWREVNHEQVEMNGKEQNCKGGKYYEKTKEYNRTGLRRERNIIRGKHQRKWKLYKDFIAPDSQLHHQWLPETADYRGVALVEANQHMRGIIDVIQILEGEITLFTEAEVSAALGPC